MIPTFLYVGALCKPYAEYTTKTVNLTSTHETARRC